MSGFKQLLNILNEPSPEDKKIDESKKVEEHVKEICNIETPDCVSPFDIKLFADELHKKSEIKNRQYAKASENITAYDISRCSRQVLYRILGKEVECFADKWLPVFMRTTIGSSIHKFIQSNTKQLTEIEVRLKVPSLRFSGVADGIIGNTGLVEIKSCTYTDYSKIIRTKRPRDSDFYQSMVYKHMLENHLDEIKTGKSKYGNKPPAQNLYKINFLQFIYIAHDIIASDIDDLGTALDIIKSTKKILNSKQDNFFFMTTLVLPVDSFDCNVYENYIMSKITSINQHLDNNTLPGNDDPFVNKNDCFFCLYNKICEIHK